jgi:hypothetical protein
MKYLALGDSYTIGELVNYNDNFPSQLVSILNEKGIEIKLDKLIAVTGWTTDELSLAIAKEKPSLDYDLVTLLIGVNNQYRGRGYVVGTSRWRGSSSDASRYPWWLRGKPNPGGSWPTYARQELCAWRSSQNAA